MKKVQLSLLLHGNMCYDRYTKQEIRAKFPLIYAAGIRAMHRFPEVTAHIDLPGLTVLSLKHHAPWLLDEMRPLIARGQLVMAGCQYAASHALCADEESDGIGGRVTMEILRDELGCEVDTFFPQEMVFHPQHPRVMQQVGARNLVVMPADWQRPRRVIGVDGTTLNVYPLNLRTCRLDALEQFYDAHDDGDFVMAGGDFELLGNVEAAVRTIEALAARGKLIEWTTTERYEREVGVADVCTAPTPFGQGGEDQIASPSFSRWVGDAEDMIWHGHAVEALEAVRAAGFASVAAVRHALGEVDVPLSESWTALPDNVWDHHFEEVGEYPETEASYLSREGTLTLLSRAWHQALIGLNSDASGWFPWTPRTRHRNLALQSAAQLAHEVQARFAGEIAERLEGGAAAGYVLALNPAPARTTEVIVETASPMRLAEAPGETLLRDGRWTTRAEVELPAYGYRLLALEPTTPTTPPAWTAGTAVERDGCTAALTDGRLTVTGAGREIDVRIGAFRLSDPSGVAATEEVTPDWSAAACRARETLFGPELEAFCELAWAVWLRLVLAPREGRVEVTAEVHIDMPRRIGRLGYDPEGLMLQFQGQPGTPLYDIPYATIEHPSAERSFVAVQRFAAIDSSASFGVVSLGGNQAYALTGSAGVVEASLGASTQGRPDTRPECRMHADGTADHLITSGGDPLLGSYNHRFALVLAPVAEVALTARRLRTPAPVIAVTPGGGDWPSQRSLLEIGPESVHVTAFRREAGGCDVVLNEVCGRPVEAGVDGERVALGPYGFAVYQPGPISSR